MHNRGAAGNNGRTTFHRLSLLLLFALMAFSLLAASFLATQSGISGGPFQAALAQQSGLSVSITSPSDGATVITAAGSFTVSGTASDNTGVDKVEVSIDGGAFAAATGTTSWTFNAAGLSDGSHTITARATDSAGNSATDVIAINVVAQSGGGGGGGSSGGGGKRVVIINNQQGGSSSVTTFPESHFAENPLDRMSVNNLTFFDVFEVSIDVAEVGQQVTISAILSNHQETEQDYAFIVQITDEDGFVVYISWQQGTIGGGQSATVSTVWTPDAAGQYSVTIFVWDGIGTTTPDPLSTVTVDNIDVEE